MLCDNFFNMKRFLLVLVITAFSADGFSQGIFDALRYADNSINGTARYMSMAGAFGALGGDASSMADNPAGLGIYRNSEMTLSANFMTTQTNTNWANMRASSTDFNFNINNATIVFASLKREKERGLIASNVSFAYNRLKNFHRSLDIRSGNNQNSMTDYMANSMSDVFNNASGTSNSLVESDLNSSADYDPYLDNSSLPWLSLMGYQGYLINPVDSVNFNSLLASGESQTSHYRAIESGRVDEYGFTYGANVSNVFYFGLGFNLQTIDYNISSGYNESFAYGGGFGLRNSFYTKGVGYNFKFGAIARVTSFLRLGFSFHTPTYYSMTDRFYTELDYENQYSGIIQSPVGSSLYRYKTPLKFQTSIAFVIGKKALISCDYLYTNYKGTRLNENSNTYNYFDADNEDIKRDALVGHTVKVGAEYRVNTSFYVRGGFAYVTPSVSGDAVKWIPLNTIRTDLEYFKDQGSVYGTGGVGYRTNRFSWDITYAYQHKKELFMPYESSELVAALVQTNTHNVVTTIAYRF